MFFKKNILLLLACTPLLWACGDEDGIEPLFSTADAPHSVIGTAAKAYQVRGEIPTIKDPSMFIVHYTDKDGVTYSVEWDKEQKTQRWAAYQVSTNNCSKLWNRNMWKGYTWMGITWAGDPFQQDPVLPTQYSTTLQDYSNQHGWGENHIDRGHIVNSNDRLISANANGQTYYLTNIQPQLNGFNSGVWLNMENRVNNWGGSMKNTKNRLFIVKGGTTQVTSDVPQPFINNPNINLKVPRFFWMAILKEIVSNNNKSYQAIAFWAEHKIDYSDDIKKYVISIDELEKRTGIDFYSNFEDNIENEFEKSYNLNSWLGL